MDKNNTNVKEYFLEKPKGLEEKTVRRFLLENADIVRFSHSAYFEFRPWAQFFWPRKRCHEKDPLFIKLLERLKTDFVKKEKTKKTYYFYKLSGNMKKIIERESFVYDIGYYQGTNFPCFEDPTFYRGNKPIGQVISHEQSVILYLQDHEKQALEKEGLRL